MLGEIALDRVMRMVSNQQLPYGYMWISDQTRLVHFACMSYLLVIAHRDARILSLDDPFGVPMRALGGLDNQAIFHGCYLMQCTYFKMLTGKRFQQKTLEAPRGRVLVVYSGPAATRLLFKDSLSQ